MGILFLWLLASIAYSQTNFDLLPQPQYEQMQHKLEKLREVYMDRLNDFSEFWRGVHHLAYGYPEKPTEILSQPQKIHNQEKRSTPQTPDLPPVCDNGGIPATTLPQDPCRGKSCKISLIRCNGILYNETTSDDIPESDLHLCTVEALVCPRNFTSTVIFPFSQASTCQLTGLRCGPGNGKYVAPPNATTEEFWGCRAQIVCDSTQVYGWGGWGYSCITQDLICNDNDTDCQVLDQLCPQDTYPAFCTSFYGICEVESPSIWTIIEGLCERESHNLLQNCEPKTIRCQRNKITDPRSYSGNFAACESVDSLQCGTQEFPLASKETEFCRVTEVTCDGKVVAFTTQQSFPWETCTVSKVVCSTTENLLITRNVECTLHSFGSSTCTEAFIKTTTTCQRQCEDSLPSQFCFCPQDKTGRLCELNRPFECKAILTSPQPNCTKTKLVGNDICFPIKLNETYQLRFNLSCGFTDLIPPLNDDDHQFQYGFVTPTWSITEDVDDWSLEVEILNMMSLSEPKFSKIKATPQTSEHLQYILVPAQLDPQLRYEIAATENLTDFVAPIFKTSPLRKPEHSSKTTTVVFDLLELPGPPGPTFWDIYGETIITAIIIVSLILGLLIILVIRRAYEEKSASLIRPTDL